MTGPAPALFVHSQYDWRPARDPVRFAWHVGIWANASESRLLAMDLCIVVPCFNEEEVLPETAQRLLELRRGLIESGKIAATSRICFVDDGSRDKTWALIERLAAAEPAIKGLKLSRNRGHQFALLAGLLTMPGDALISVDADLQDDLGAIPRMIDACQQGAQIVYGVRQARHTDSFGKRTSAQLYYRILSAVGVEVIFDHADYRLMTRPVLHALAQYDEVNVFLRGLIPQLGFPTATVYYARQERFAGTSKYPLGKMLALAWDGITSFSAAPLRFITGLGLLVSLGSLAITAWAISVRLFGHSAVPGWASTVLPIYFIGGIQLFALGIIGEYMAKIYLETKRRPRFIIEKSI